MVDLRRIFKDYRDSGAFHALVPVQAALGGGVFVTKSGDLLMLLALGGSGHECLDPGQTEHVSRRFESVLQTLDERFRLYQYLLKRQAPDLPFQHHTQPIVEEATRNRMAYLGGKSESIYGFESYLAVVYEGWRPQIGWRTGVSGTGQSGAAISRRLSTDRTLSALERDLDTAREFLVNKVSGFVIQCRDFIDIRALDERQGFRFLRTLLNYTPHKNEGVRLKHASFVDYQACGSALECHREYLRLDDWYVQTLTLKEPPSRTFAQMLRGLLEIPSNYIIASEWKRESSERVRRLVRRKRRHFHNSKASFLNFLNDSKPAPQDMLIDDGAVALVADLGACLEEIEVHGRHFGEFSLTLVLYSRISPACDAPRPSF